MNTFNYNSSEVNYYVSSDYGSITDPVTSTVDNGDTAYDLVVSGDYIVTGDVLVNDFNVEPDYDEIVFTDTTYPFGTIKIGSEVAPAATVVFVAKPEPLKLYSKAIPVRKRAWVGSGTLFELSNGLERIAAPYIGGSGPLRVSGAAEDSATFKFTEESVKTYGADVDFGLVTGAIGSSVDYGQTTDVVDEGETNYGDIVVSDGIPYGVFRFAGGNTTDLRIKAYQGSGSATISGQLSEQFNEPTPQIYIVNNVHSGRIPSLFRVYNSVNPDAFSRASYIGSGSLFEIGQKDEKAVFVYDVGSIVPEIVLAPWNGTSEYTGSNIHAVASGTGTSSTNGFNSSTTTYWKFTAQSESNTYGTDPRILTLGQLDLRNYNQFEFTAIAGTSNNGGENCDADENLEISYSIDGGTTYTQITVLDAEDVRFTGTTFGLVTVDIPAAAKTSNVTLKFHQEKHSGTGFDEWGIEYVKLLENTEGSGQVYETIGSVDQGTVDHGTGITEDYGTVTEGFTNGILDYGQLTPGFFKFGNINISGRASIPFKASYHGEGQLSSTGGRATIQFTEPALQVYNYGLSKNQTSQGEFLKFGGSANERTAKVPPEPMSRIHI